MGIKMVRIDDRLIHGQIVAAWAKTLDINRIWIVDDGVAQDEFLKNVMSLVAPSGVDLVITSMNDIPVLSKEYDESEKNTLILVKYPYVAQKIFSTGIKCQALNVGGMGANSERSKLFRNISASPAEVQTLREIKAAGVDVYFQVTHDEKRTQFE